MRLITQCNALVKYLHKIVKNLSFMKFSFNIYIIHILLEVQKVKTDENQYQK